MSEAAPSRLDSAKWVVVLAVVAGGVYGNSYYGDQPILYRVLALLVLALVAGWIASLTQKGSDFLTLVKGSRTEIRKVVWPTSPPRQNTPSIHGPLPRPATAMRSGASAWMSSPTRRRAIPSERMAGRSVVSLLPATRTL